MLSKCAVARKKSIQPKAKEKLFWVCPHKSCLTLIWDNQWGFSRHQKSRGEALLLYELTLTCLFWQQSEWNKKLKSSQEVACYLVGFKQLWLFSYWFHFQGEDFTVKICCTAHPPSSILVHTEIRELHLVDGDRSILVLAVTWRNGSRWAGRRSEQEE